MTLNGCENIINLSIFKSTMKWKMVFIVFLIVILFSLIASPYIKAEYLTNKYGDQFKELYSLNGWIDEIEFFRVIDYSENEAKVYYVEKDRLTTNYFYFQRGNKANEWELKTWQTVYARFGSADDAAWPYYFKEWF